MKIVVAGGTNAAEYIIKNFKSSKNELIVINNDKKSAEQIAKDNRVPVLYGDPSKKHVLNEAHIEGYDIFISVSDKDENNFCACYLAKKAFNIKKCIAIIILFNRHMIYFIKRI